MPTVETVTIETKNGPVRINKSDFNPKEHKIAKGEIAPVNDPGFIAPNAPLVPATSETPPMQMFVGKKGKKYIVTDQSGNPVERDGINADGYDDEKGAWDAITAVMVPSAS